MIEERTTRARRRNFSRWIEQIQPVFTEIVTATHRARGRYNRWRRRNMNARWFPFVVALGWACSSNDGAPVDVTGVYNGPVTNGPNSCPGIWNTGAMNDAMATVAQSGSSASIQVQGAAGLLLVAGFGTNSFSGSVNGSHINATIIGSVSTTRGGCIYTSNGALAGDLNGNTLSGSIVYTPQTNGHADCASMQVAGCNSQQSFSLTRAAK
jgi:hypothetical protein